jgi:3-deoxy-D-manno-octulosonic-acid transferase
MIAKCSIYITTLLYLPALLGSFFNAKLRTVIGERFYPEPFSSKSEKISNVIWIHAASVGEIAGVEPLVKKIKQANPSSLIAISTTTITGKTEAIRKQLANFVFILPFDQPLVLHRLFRYFDISVFVIAETEIWPNLLFYLKRKNVPVVLVNGRISDYSFPRYQRLSWFFSKVLGCFERILVQSPADKERFMAIGAEPAKISVTGSTKYDQDIEILSSNKRVELIKQFNLSPSAPCFVAGSVREGEDLQVINVYKSLQVKIPTLQFIIAPRHPERFVAVGRLLTQSDISFESRSKIGERDIGLSCQVLLLDTLGELSKAYSIATAAFVGGSLVDIGGHNPMEPAAFGCPILMGPFSSNVKDIVASLKREGGLLEVQNSDALERTLENILTNDELRKKIGGAARKVFEQNLGATQEALQEILSQSRGNTSVLHAA